MRSMTTDKHTRCHVGVCNGMTPVITGRNPFIYCCPKKNMDWRAGDRILVRDGIYAVIESFAPQICQIRDMGENGMSFIYYRDGETYLPSETADFLVSGFGFRLEGIPFRIVDEFQAGDEPAGRFEKITVCVEFVDLTEDQKEMIRHFITHYIGKSIN